MGAKNVKQVNGRTKRFYRFLIGGLVCSIAVPSFALTWYAVSNAKEVRLHQARENNLTRAKMGATLLDADYGREIISLRKIASSVDLPNIDASAAQRILKRVSNSVSNLQVTAVYSRTGQVIKALPAWKKSVQPAPISEWFGNAATVLRPSPLYVNHVVSAGSAKSLALVLPLGNRAPTGYLLVAWNDRFPKWLAHLSMEGTGLYIVDRNGQKLASSIDPHLGKVPLMTSIPPRLSHPSAPGSSIEQGTPGLDEMVAGYAFAPSAECTLLVLQPKSAVLAGTDRLAALFWGVYAAMLLFGALTAWKLASAFDRHTAMARTLEEQNTQLIEADRDRSDILANISHNLRTPLASLHVTVSSLLDTPENTGFDSVREKLWSAYEDVELVDAGVRNMLEMSRIEEIFLTNKEPADLTDIVSAALARLKPRLKGWKVSLDFPTYPLIIDCDQSRIETVIVNLLENALKYAPPGSQLSMGGMAREGYALFTLSDEGPGVKPGEEELIFDKFYRSPSNTTKGGTGLGLAICKAIIKRHNGRIGVKSGIDGGAEFWFSLPLFYYETKGL